MSIRDYLRPRATTAPPTLEAAVEPTWPPIETVSQRRDRLRAEREAQEATVPPPEPELPSLPALRRDARTETALMVLDTARELIADRSEADVRAVRLLIERAIELLGTEPR